jgi:hypothetical protein
MPDRIPQTGGAAAHVRGVGAPRQRPHPGQQFLEGERLDQVVVGAKIEPDDAVAHRVPRREDEHVR